MTMSQSMRVVRTLFPHISRTLTRELARELHKVMARFGAPTEQDFAVGLAELARDRGQLIAEALHVLRWS